MRRAQQSVVVYSGDKAVCHCPSCPSTLPNILPCAKHLLGEYLNSRSITYQKQNAKVKIGRVYTASATIWRLYCFQCARKREKGPKCRHFEVTDLLGEEHLRSVRTEGAYSLNRWLEEGLVYSIGLFRSVQVLLFGRYCFSFVENV